MRELLDRKSSSCRSCAMRIRMASVDPEHRRRIAVTASHKAADILKSKPNLHHEKYGEVVFKQHRRILTGASNRCNNPNCPEYKNYGGRGIRFLFPSPTAAADWVLNNLGPRINDNYSIDRIDNNRHYEPGNLRWATKEEQANNKRAYKRTEIGERIRYIQSLRQDLTYETIRSWIHFGKTDEEILSRRKWSRISDMVREQ